MSAKKAPSLSSLDPSSILSGSATTSVNVSGSNLTSCKVLVDGFVPSQNVLSDNHISVELSAAMLVRPGKRVVVAHNLDSGEESNELGLEILKQDGSVVRAQDDIPVKASVFVADKFFQMPMAHGFASSIVLNIEDHFRNALLNSGFHPDRVDIQLGFGFKSITLQPIVFSPGPEVETPVLVPAQRVQNGGSLPDIVHFDVNVQFPMHHSWFIDWASSFPHPPLATWPLFEPSDPFSPSAQLDCSTVALVKEIDVTAPHHPVEDITIPPMQTFDLGVSAFSLPVNVPFEFDFVLTGTFNFQMHRGNTTTSSTSPIGFGDMFRAYPHPLVSVIDAVTIAVILRGRYVGVIFKRFETTKVRV